MCTAPGAKARTTTPCSLWPAPAGSVSTTAVSRTSGRSPPMARAPAPPALPPLTAGTDWASTDRLHTALYADTGLTVPLGHLPQLSPRRVQTLIRDQRAVVLARLQREPAFVEQAH